MHTCTSEEFITTYWLDQLKLDPTHKKYAGIVLSTHRCEWSRYTKLKLVNFNPNEKFLNKGNNKFSSKALLWCHQEPGSHSSKLFFLVGYNRGIVISWWIDAHLREWTALVVVEQQEVLAATNGRSSIIHRRMISGAVRSSRIFIFDIPEGREELVKTGGHACIRRGFFLVHDDGRFCWCAEDTTFSPMDLIPASFSRVWSATNRRFPVRFRYRDIRKIPHPERYHPCVERDLIIYYHILFLRENTSAIPGHCVWENRRWLPHVKYGITEALP